MTDANIAGPIGLSSMRDDYPALFDRLARWFWSDDRVRAMWLYGAIARGAADAGSDLDVCIAVRDDQVAAFGAQWQTWLAEMTPTVSAVPISPGSFYALTPDCHRFDVITEAVSKVPASPLQRRILVFDKDGMADLGPAICDPPPDAAAIEFLVRETLRQAANFPVVIVRQDWLLGVVAVQQIHTFLYQLYCEANKPTPPTGPKQWSFKLTEAQRATLEALPVAAPTEASVRAARRAALGVFFRDTPGIAATAGVAWPDALDAAVRTYLARVDEALPDPAGPASTTPGVRPTPP